MSIPNLAILLLTLTLGCMIISCTNVKTDDFNTTSSGLKYQFITDVESEKPEIDDIMIMHMMYSTSYDSVLFNSKIERDSFHVVLVEPTFIGGVEEGFAMMSPGDSVVFKVSADSVYEKTFYQSLPEYLSIGDELTFNVKMLGLIRRSVYDSLELANDIEARRAEFELIDQYMAEKNLEIMPTENGLYYLSLKEGSGELAKKGDTITANYTGSLLNGKVFDSSDWKDEPFTFIMGNDMVLPGWEEGLPLMRKGGKALMLLPSDLAFGARHVGEVPPYSSLLFEIEILEISGY